MRGVLVLLAVLALVAASCGNDDTTAETTTTTAAETTTTAAVTTTAAETTTTSEGPMVEPIQACQVTDTGGIDDKSFNQTAFKGVTDAIAAGYATADSSYLESQVESDYAPNIQSSLDKGCDLIITVGFLLGDATKAAAEANPDQKFEILDYAYDPTIDNVVGAVFNTAEAAFLAGYLAAGVTETGIVATYGGIQIPGAVTAFMDGFAWGVDYYNTENGTSVEVLGWDPDTQTGVFTGDFESLDKGKAVTQSFIEEGADVILPVAGPVGEGTAQLALERGDVWVVGVDADWFDTLPAYSDVILSSVLKGLDVAVSSVIKDAAEGNFEGGTRVFTLAEDGVGLGKINPSVSADLVAGVDAVKAGIKDGSITVG
jgi:basic membrane protein A